jgi:hypothetical protein
VINRRPLPDEVVDARARFEQLCATIRPELERRLERRRELHREIVGELRRAHSGLVEETDFDPEVDTAAAASWMMGGRCLSLAGAFITLVAAGHGGEVLPTARSLHEASRMLAVLLDPAEASLHEKWLAGEWVRPKHMSAAEQRNQTRLVEEMIRAGVRPPERTDEVTKDVYELLSGPAHHSRGSFEGEFNRTLRRYVYGPVDSPVRRAYWQRQADAILYDAYLSVGLLLTKVHGPSLWVGTVEPALRAVRDAQADDPLLPPEVAERSRSL